MRACACVCFSASRELARFIAAGKLHCKIDKVSGIVETTRPDKRNYQYQVRSSAVYLCAGVTCFVVHS